MSTSREMGAVKGPEVYGWEARLYDAIILGATFGLYPGFVKRFVSQLPIGPGSRVLEAGVGTGLNAPAILKRIGPSGEFVGIDVSEDMLRQARRRLRRHPNVRLLKIRAEEPWDLGKFDLVLMAFVFHGLKEEQRRGFLRNALASLKPGGHLALLDYAQFDPQRAWWPVKFLITKLECPEAARFVRMDLERYLWERGFKPVASHPHFWGYIRLLLAKPSVD